MRVWPHLGTAQEASWRPISERRPYGDARGISTARAIAFTFSGLPGFASMDLKISLLRMYRALSAEEADQVEVDAILHRLGMHVLSASRLLTHEKSRKDRPCHARPEQL